MSSKPFGVHSDWGLSGNAGCNWKDLRHVVGTDQHRHRGVARLGGAVTCEPCGLEGFCVPRAMWGLSDSELG